MSPCCIILQSIKYYNNSNDHARQPFLIKRLPITIRLMPTPYTLESNPKTADRSASKNSSKSQLGRHNNPSR